MELSPEERRKIYEEEKARIEAREQLERERGRISPEATVNLPPNVAGLLCYVLGWVSGIVFLILEPKNKFVRYHAIQSIIVFGAITIASAILSWIPFIGAFLSWALGVLAIILWIVLMVKAYKGTKYKLPVSGDQAEKWAAESKADKE